MTDRDNCLRMIGDIAVRWSSIEKDLRELLWLYVGTDRPTFDLLFGRAAPAHIHDTLRKVVIAKEVDPTANADALEALGRCKTIRDNRNIVLHKMRSDHVDDATALLPKLVETQQAIALHADALRTCRQRLGKFVAARDALETPDGDEEAPDAGQVPTYESIQWPPKCTKLEFEDI